MSKVSSGDSKNTLYCSFCGKSQHEVRKLIAGPTVFIYDECVELCMDTPIVSAICSRLIPRSTRFLICERLARGDTICPALGPTFAARVFLQTGYRHRDQCSRHGISLKRPKLNNGVAHAPRSCNDTPAQDRCVQFALRLRYRGIDRIVEL
jgi:hypothetical protein